MTREQYKAMREAELEQQKAEADAKRSARGLTPLQRDNIENEYQALCQLGEEWARGGFWTEMEQDAFVRSGGSQPSGTGSRPSV